MTEVFISYVREDERTVKYLCDIMERNGIKVWLDREQLEPGVRWKIAIENAIRQGAYFISVYSRARQSRDQTYANEELVVAVEEIRKRPINKSWFIPVKIDECEIEPRPIGGGETILDFQISDLRKWSTGLRSLLIALGVTDPIVDLRQPLASGLPPALEIENGFVRYENIEGVDEIFQGMEHRVPNGWCRRENDNSIIAYFELYAPLKKFQDFNRLLGYTSFHAFCEDEEISLNPNRPSTFVYQRNLLAPRGTLVPNMAGQGMIELPFDLPFTSSFIAKGSITQFVFSGIFEALLEMQTPGQSVKQKSSGMFEMNMSVPTTAYI